MKSKLSPLLLFFAVVLLAIVGGIWGWWHWKFPYGHRTCFMPCMMSALQLYAAENKETFPDGTNSYVALQKLYPRYMIRPDNFAGMSRNIETASQIVMSGGTLTSNECSWIYFPGINRGDGPDLMILYERTPGITGIGARCPGHAVGFSGGYIRMIPDAEWESFLAEQAKRRRELQTLR